MDLFTNFATYRDILEAIQAMPDDMKDTVAYVWMPHDVSWDRLPAEFVPITSLSPFDGSMPPSNNNPMSISVYNWA